MKIAIAAYILAGLVGFGLLVASVYVLAGFGWSLLAGAFSCFSVSAFIRRGLTKDQRPTK